MLSVVILWDHIAWVSVCVEHNIVGQGDTHMEAVNNFLKTFEGEQRLAEEYGRPITEIKPSPERFKDLFQNSKPFCIEPERTGLVGLVPSIEFRVSDVPCPPSAMRSVFL
jgi:hypothetical protein